MADSPLDQMLLEFGVDLTPVKNAGEQIKVVLDAVNSIQERAATRTNTTARDQQKQLAEMRFLAASAVQEATRAIAEESKKSAIYKAQTDEVIKQQQERLLSLKTTEQETAELQKQTAELQRQSAEIRKAKLEGKGEGGGKEGGGGIAGFLGVAARSVFGSGLVGSIAGGFLAGEGVKASIEGVGRFIDKLKEMQDQASQVTLIEDQFKRLAKAAGIDDVQAIARLRQETEGLVSKMDLMRTATAALKSPFGLSIETVEKLTGATVKLAEANGHTAKQAIDALTLSLTSGRTQQLMYMTGLAKAAGIVDDVSASASRLGRQVVTVNHMVDLLLKQSAAMGEMPQTLQQMVTRIQVSWHDLLLEFGKGFNLSAGMQVVFDIFRKLTDGILSLSEGAVSLGKKFGDGFLALTVGAESGVPVLKALFKTLMDVLGLSASLFGFRDAWDSISKSAGTAKDKFEETHPVLSKVIDDVLMVNIILERIVLAIDKVINKFKDLSGYLPHPSEIIGGGGVPGAIVENKLGVREFMNTPPEQMIDKYFRSVPKPPTARPIGDTADTAAHSMLPPKKDLGAETVDEEFKRRRDELHKAYSEKEELLDKERPGIEKPEVGGGERTSQKIKLLEMEAKNEIALLKQQASDIEALSRLSLKNEQEMAKLRLAQREGEISQRRDMDDAAYHAGDEQLEQHLQNQRDLAEADRQAKLTEARVDLRASLEDVRTKYQTIGNETKDVATRSLQELADKYKLLREQAGANLPFLNKEQGLAEAGITEKQIETEKTNKEKQAKEELQVTEVFNAKVIGLNTARDHKLAQIDLQGANARSAAKQKEYQDELVLTEKHLKDQQSQVERGLRLEQQLTEKRFRSGELAPDDYYQQRAEQVQALAKVQIDTARAVGEVQAKAAQDEFANGENSPLRAAELAGKLKLTAETTRDAIKTSVQTATDTLDVLFDKAAVIQTLLDDINKRYGAAQQALESRVSSQQEQGPGIQFGTPTSKLLEQLQANLAGQRDELDSLLNKAKPYSEEWYRIYDQTERVYQLQVKYTLELQKMRDLMVPIGASFDAIGRSIQQNFQSKFAQNVAGLLQAGGKSIQQSTDLGRQIRGEPVVVDPRMEALQKQASDIFTRAQSSSITLADRLKLMGDAVARVTDYLQSLAEHPKKPEEEIPAGTQAQTEDLKGILTEFQSDLKGSPPKPQLATPVPVPPGASVAVGPVVETSSVKVAPVVVHVGEHAPAATTESPTIRTFIDRLDAWTKKLAVPPAPAVASKTERQTVTPPLIETPKPVGGTAPKPVEIVAVQPKPTEIPVIAPKPAAPDIGPPIDRLVAVIQSAIDKLGALNLSNGQEFEALSGILESLRQSTGFVGPGTIPSVTSTIIYGNEAAPESAKPPVYEPPISKPSATSEVKLAAPLNNLVTPLDRLAVAIQGAIDKLDTLASKEVTTPETVSSGEVSTSTEASGLPSKIGKSGDFGGETSSPDSAGKSGDSFKVLTDKVLASATAIDNFTQSILNAHSAIGGAAGGVAGGAGLGNTLDQVFKGLGPWGAVGGAVVGGVMGAVVGNKQAEVTQHMHDFEYHFKTIMDQFAQNTNNLQSTIEQIVQLLAEVQAMQSSSKKGSAQYQSLIDQYTQQLMQLRDQQGQVIRNLEQTAGLLNTPIGAQSFVSNLQDIMKQYIQFIGAARPGTDDLTQAMNYLNGATAAYAQTLETQVLSDNTQAIQDALQLNDLIYQRTNMILDYNNAVSSALSAGVLTRQMTRAQTAGQAVEKLTIEYTRQREQIDEQISAAQTRVAAETTIFGLANTRVGLENQLLLAQNQQTLLDMQRIGALAELVAAMSTGNFAMLPGLTDALAAIIKNLPNYNGPDAATLDQLIAAAYQQRAAQGFATFRGAGLP